MHLLWTLIEILIVLTAIATIVDLIRSHRSSVAGTIGWIVLIVVLPFIGSIIYWATKKRTSADVERQFQAQAELQRERGRKSFDHTGNPM